MKQIEGKLIAPAKARFAVVISRFNEFITSKLLGGCMDSLKRHGADEAAVEVIWSPGAFEIPLIAQRLAATKKYAAVICLGAVIRGGTDHYEYVAAEAAKGIAQAAMGTGTPVIFGVLTCDTLDQAIHRVGAKAGNKGFEATVCAVEMVNLVAKLPG